MYNNHIDTLLFCWKIHDVVDESKVSRISELTRKTNTYFTRAVRRNSKNDSPKYLPNTGTRHLPMSETAVDSRVAEEFDDPDIVLDLRKTDPIVELLRSFGKSWMHILMSLPYDRRHRDVLHMPVA